MIQEAAVGVCAPLPESVPACGVTEGPGSGVDEAPVVEVTRLKIRIKIRAKAQIQTRITLSRAAQAGIPGAPASYS